MASEYLIAKWRVWWKSLDVNHDGSISRDDRDECRRKWCDLHDLHDDMRKKVMDVFGKWWNNFIFRGHTGHITEDEFIEYLKQDYAADKEKFRKDVDEGFSLIFDVFDTDRDGTITAKELVLAFKAYGHENATEEQSLFELYRPVGGHVPVRRVVDTWVQLVINEDSTQEELVYDALRKGA